MKKGGLKERRIRGQKDRRTGRQEDRMTGGQKDKRTAGQQDSRTAGQEDSRTAGQQDTKARRKVHQVWPAGGGAASWQEEEPLQRERTQALGAHLAELTLSGIIQ